MIESGTIPVGLFIIIFICTGVGYLAGIATVVLENEKKNRNP